jgi:putative membrane protein
MLTNIIKGSIVGISNIIPGISGGTALVLLGVFDKTMDSISKIFNFKEKRGKKEAFIFLGQLAIGIIIGLIGFAKIISFLFENYPTQTIYWFVGLMTFSVPILINTEIKKIRFTIPYFILGLVVIIGVIYLNPGEKNLIINSFPEIDFNHILLMIQSGFIGGFITIIPGISGSMVLLILGRYYLIQSYLAQSTSLQPNILIPILIFGIGACLGIVVGSKVISFLLKKQKDYTMSFIFGLVIMSIIAIIPFDAIYDTITIITSILSFLFGGFLIEITKPKTTKKVQ